jgi:hypothetical protein
MTASPPPAPPADTSPDPDGAPGWVQGMAFWLSALSLAAYLLFSNGIHNHIRFLWAALADVRRVTGI